MADWNGFKKNGTTYIPNDATARAGVIANTKLIKDTVGWSGKNKLAIKFSYVKANIVGTWSGNTVTINGISLSFEVDSNGYVTKITGGGSNASADTTVVLVPRTSPDGLVLATGDYKANGTPTLPNGCFVRYFCTRGGNAVVLGDDTGSGIECSIQNTDVVGCLISVPSGKSVNGLVFNLMLRDADILDDTYEPYFGSTAFPRSEQAVLGAKNFIRYDKISLIDGKYELTNTGIRVYNESAHIYSRVVLTGLQLPKNAHLKLTCNCTITSGDAQWNFSGKNTGSEPVTIVYSRIASSGEVTLDIPSTGDYETYEVALLCTRATSELGNVTFSDLMLSFDGGTYAPPAMTNKELTDAVKEEQITSATWTAEATTKQITIHRFGKVVQVYGYLEPTTAVAVWSEVVSNLPKPKTYAYMSDVKSSAAFSVEPSGNVGHIIAATALNVGTRYIFSFTYLAAD